MKILLVSQDWFKTELQAAGHEVVSCGADNHFDVRLTVSLIHWAELVSLCPWQPDAVIVFDNSVPVFICGLETLGIPLFFYSVDVHHHLEWQQWFPAVFDSVFVAQRDYLDGFRGGFRPVAWLPLWATRVSEESAEKRHDAVFVGTLDRALNPDRVSFFDRLRERLPITCLMGDFWKIYPESRVIVNQTVRGDLNFRVFEALASGVPLVTERSQNGLLELFTEGVHLVTYERNDWEDAASKIKGLLLDEERRHRIGANGKREVLSKHCAVHRAKVLIEALGTEGDSGARSRFALVPNFVALGIFLEGQKRNAVHAYAEALRLIEQGAAAGEPMPYETAQNIMQALSHFDRNSKTPRARHLLEILMKRYPERFKTE